MNKPLEPLLPKRDAQLDGTLPSESPALRWLLGVTDHLALVLDAEGRTASASEPMLKSLGLETVEPILGLRPGEVIRCLWASQGETCCGNTVHCASCGVHLAIRECRNLQTTTTRESLLSLHNAGAGTLGEFKLRATPIRLGEASFIFLSLQDLSEHKRREALEHFFFHQVLNLVDGLEGTVRILAAEPESAPLLIQQLTDFTKQLTQEVQGQRILLQAENGSLQVELQAIELSEIMESLSAFFRNHDAAHRRHLELQPHRAERFCTDPTLLLKILVDLITNAFDATPVGGTVRVTYLREGGQRLFTVHNAGVIPPETAVKVFQRSFISKVTGGWGLGTFGLRLLAERYLDGHLLFTTGEEQGTSFTLHLPALEPVEEFAPLPRPEEVLQPSPVPMERARLGTVLIVDDTRVTRHLLQSILSKDFRVIPAENGMEALALALEHLPDLIVLDVVMPEMDGYSVCRRFKADPRTASIPVIFLTALTGKSDETQALEAGAIDFITKPINPDVVYARVRNHVEMKRTQDHLKDLSLQDSLTGIPNRRAFDHALEHEWRRGIRSRNPLSVIMGDVDFFKRYNDSLGHQQGDICLQQVAQVFASAIRRPSDTVARYGGEEFVCILGDTEAEGALTVAEKIRTGIEALKLLHPDSDLGQHVTISLGIATVVPDHQSGSLSLVECADQRLYEAKRAGRNRVVGSSRAMPSTPHQPGFIPSE